MKKRSVYLGGSSLIKSGSVVYRYGFNGQEKSDEIYGTGNSYTAEFWQYDARIGRRWNVDPVVKPNESSYATFGNNPIVNIDPNGADTINIIHTTTRRKFRSLGGGLDGIAAKEIPDQISYNSSINIVAAKGDDIFRITNTEVTFDEDGNEGSTSNTHTLRLNNPQTFYRTGGHSMPGYLDDRYALAANAPGWLLSHYASKSNDIGVRSAIAYQKDIPFVAGVQKVMDAAYIVTGAYGVARLTLGAALASTSSEMSFFAGTRYTSKVWKQMQLGDAHAFPEGVKAFEKYGIRTMIKGGDGIEREMLKIPGGYKNRNGFFEFIKEADGSINHRLFRPNL